LGRLWDTFGIAAGSKRFAAQAGKGCVRIKSAFVSKE